MKLTDLFTDEALDQAVTEGLVRVQMSPDGRLRILNYTEQVIYTRAWTDVTRRCRGLIVDADGAIIARPWPKFFNYGEHAADMLDLTAPVEVTDKADGSLGILYPATDGPAIATRGSFTSEQATHATELYRQRYEGKWDPSAGVTYLFEVVYPSNRIVIDYGDLDDLILLGAVHISTGMLIGPGQIVAGDGWPGPVVRTFDYRTLADALAAEPRPNAEGLVVRYLAGVHAGTMLKLKQDDYVALHRIITGLTARRIWERLAVWACLAATPDLPHRRIAQALHMDPADVSGIVAAGPDWREDIKRTAPEEFTEWIDATVGGLEDQAYDIRSMVEGEVIAWRGQPRKDVALAIADHPFRGLIFAALDGKPYEAQTWAEIRPAAEKPFRAVSEDVA